QPAVTPNGAYVVQAGAFSTADRANKVASAVGGSISRSGKLFRVRTGPFGSRAQAEASLAKVKAAGYSDARIFTNG
ncbi:MAG TPA: SPOR domain-containing protein, partial [Croceibacterium sp.]|nr:SPOR domain-containing protein [Croceibacterium sp.]